MLKKKKKKGHPLTQEDACLPGGLTPAFRRDVGTGGDASQAAKAPWTIPGGPPSKRLHPWSQEEGCSHLWLTHAHPSLKRLLVPGPHSAPNKHTRSHSFSKNQFTNVPRLFPLDFKTFFCQPPKKGSFLINYQGTEGKDRWAWSSLKSEKAELKSEKAVYFMPSLHLSLQNEK